MGVSRKSSSNFSCLEDVLVMNHQFKWYQNTFTLVVVHQMLVKANQASNNLGMAADVL